MNTGGEKLPTERTGPGTEARLDPLAEAVAGRAREAGLLRPGERVLAAVSGGADSLAMLHILWSAKDYLGLEALAVASLDHGLRGPEGAADVAFVGEVAARLGLPFHGGKLAPGLAAAEPGSSPEDAARRARYAFLGNLARTWGPGAAGAVRVATGHTADDQAETVLMRIIEGTGLRGLAGIPARREEDGWVLVRPLLGVGRSETEDYCRRCGLEPRVDASNEDRRFRRNLVRNRVLPVLKDYNPKVVQALLRLADLARAEVGDDRNETEAIEGLIQRGAVPEGESPFADLDTARGDVVFLPKPTLAALGDRLRARLVRAAVAAVGGETVLRDLGYEGALRAARAATSLRVGGRLDLPGEVVLEAGYRHVFFAAVPGGEARRAAGASGRHEVSEARGAAGAAGIASVTLAPAGTTEIPALGWVFRVERLRGPGRVEASASAAGPIRLSVDLDPSRLSFPLSVRTRRRGDVFHPAGLGRPGEGLAKKLKDFFIAAKVPRAERNRWPLVVDGRDRVVWVTGLRADERFVARAASEMVLRVKAERRGPEGDKMRHQPV